MGTFNEDEAMKALKSGYEKAEKTLKDEDKLEKILQRAEEKLKKIPRVGDILAYLPLFISLVRSYVIKEYDEIPIGSIIAIVSSIIYVVSPIDLIPDWIPGAGYLDDAAVVTACLTLVKTDIDDYCKWREKNGKII